MSCAKRQTMKKVSKAKPMFNEQPNPCPICRRTVYEELRQRLVESGISIQSDNIARMITIFVDDLIEGNAEGMNDFYKLIVSLMRN